MVYIQIWNWRIDKQYRIDYHMLRNYSIREYFQWIMTYILVCDLCEVIAVTSQNLEYTGENLCEDSSTYNYTVSLYFKTFNTLLQCNYTKNTE